MGAAYRQEVTEPVGVPGMVREGASGSNTAAAPVSAGTPSMPEVPQGGNVGTASAPRMDGATGGAVVGQPVAPVPAGQVQMDSPVGDGPVPTLQLADGNGSGEQAVYVAGQPTAAGATGGKLTFTDRAAAAPAAAVRGQGYVVLPGDTLGKIAMKFYKSSKGEAVQRIVAANPKVLKDDKAMLIAGKKLTIPTVAAVAKAAAPADAVAANSSKKTAVVIHQPGGAGASKAAVGPEVAAAIPQKAAGKVYVVQAGDTLEKIARKASPGNVSGMVKKLEAANGIDDPTALRVGQKLKVPTV